MLGGGSFVSQNKVLPGAYINFVSATKGNMALSERGVTAVPLMLSWGAEKQVFEVSAEDFRNRSLQIFGYPIDAPEMIYLRELFSHAKKAICYRLGTGVKAANDFATARYSGVRGNDIKIVIEADPDAEGKFQVKTLLGQKEIDTQKVAAASELVNNDFVEFKKDGSLTQTAGTPLTGGEDATTVSGTDHSDFLKAMESQSFHTLCCPVAEDSAKALYISFTKRMREENGAKFQTVVYRKADANFEGVISVENEAVKNPQGLVYWVSGICASCEINKTNENKLYDGELGMEVGYTQDQLSQGVKDGKLMFHKVGSQIRVLMDINTLVTPDGEKGEDFKNNQTIRVLDQIGNDIATMFQTRYLGSVLNDNAGRIGLWNDLISYLKNLSQIRAIEDVKAEEITVAQGDTKRSVVVNCPVTPINCMSQLYMTVIVQ